MALWKEVLTLKSEDLQQVFTFYNDHICPIEVRIYCASWIEEETNKGTDAATFYNGIIHQLQSKSASLLTSDQFWVKIKLCRIVEFFEKTYRNNPGALLQIITHNIQKEYELVNQSEQRRNSGVTGIHQGQDLASSSTRRNSGYHVGISDSLQAAKKTSSDADAALRKIEDELQAVNLNYQEFQRCRALMTRQQQNNPAGEDREMSMELHRLQIEINSNLRSIATLKEYFEGYISILVRDLMKLMSQVLDDELPRWVNAQCSYGKEVYTDIDLIQRWCEELVDLIWITREQLKNAEQKRFPAQPHQNSGSVNKFTEPLRTCTRLLTELLRKSFIIHSIPSQVLRTCTRFPPPYLVTIRFLIGGKLNVFVSPPSVQIELINEKNAKCLVEKGVGGKPNGSLQNNKGRMEYNRDTGEFSAVFKNLKMMSREKSNSVGGGSGNLIVTREKFYLVATSEISIGDLNLKLWALSSPLVVISHGSQEAQGWATITWTNMFGEGPAPQVAPDAVTWPQVADLLNRFTERTLGRGLSQQNLDFLATKVPIKNNIITLSDFAADKKAVPGLEFSFWEWFYRAIKLIEKEKNLKELWGDGYIIGFIGKNEGESRLRGCTSGNFLIRISESVLGAITFSWIEKDGNVYSMEPFTSYSLKIQSLAEKVHDLDNFEYLYPDIPKDIVFKKYYEVMPSSSVGRPFQYVKPFVMMMLRGSQFQGSSSSTNPGSTRSSISSPSSYYGSSPNTPPSHLNVNSELHSNQASPHVPDVAMDVEDTIWSDLEDILQSQSTLPIFSEADSVANADEFLNDEENTPL